MGRGAPADDAAAFRAYQSACEHGSSVACHNAGLIARRGATGEAAEGSGVAASSAARARALFTRACEADYAYGCWALGDMTRLGEGGPASPERAFELLRASCLADVFEACAPAGQMRLDGYGVEPNAAEGAALLQRACTESDPGACALLASVLEEGHGLPADAERAARLRRFACARGVARACADEAAHEGDAPR